MITQAFLETHKQFKNGKVKFDASFSGTTVCICLLNQKSHTLTCANAGDSWAILFLEEEDKSWSIKELSSDHKPDLPKEFERITITGGRVFPYADQNGNPVGPHRVWL